MTEKKFKKYEFMPALLLNDPLFTTQIILFLLRDAEFFYNKCGMQINYLYQKDFVDNIARGLRLNYSIL